MRVGYLKIVLIIEYTKNNIILKKLGKLTFLKYLNNNFNYRLMLVEFIIIFYIKIKFFDIK